MSAVPKRRLVARLGALLMFLLGVNLSLPAVAERSLDAPLGASPPAIADAAPLARRLSPRTAISRCLRWQSVAAAMGETWAGHRLRRSVVARACALSGAAVRDDPPWNWPWRDGGLTGRLPPYRIADHGSWTIRCGTAGRRRRCALIHVVPLPEEGPTNRSPRIITHFVIDTLARRESVVWRLLLIGDGVAPGAHLEVRLQGENRPETFDHCAATACLMEADTDQSARVANALWDGEVVVVHVHRPAGPPMALRLPARGFKSGLAKLNRLRQEEWRGLATQGPGSDDQADGGRPPVP